MLTHARARATCGHWHGGQWSALYQFASSGIFVIKNTLHYQREIEDARTPEYNLHPGFISIADDNTLRRLQEYFAFISLNLGLKIEWGKSEQYGYRIPYLTEDTPTELEIQVEQVKYLP